MIMGWLSRWRLSRVSGLASAPPEPEPAEQVDGIPEYLRDMSWKERKRQMLAKTSDWAGGAFAEANAAYVHETVLATGDDAHMHVVFNIGADALRTFVQSNDYKNVYERPVVEGKRLKPSQTRLDVDRIVGLDKPEKYYFCALSIGGTGMRFYGEYCVVLKSPNDAAGVERVLDRNSYDFVMEPLKGILKDLSVEDQQRLAAKLTCEFRSIDFGDMLTIKVMQHHTARPRRLTIGALGEALLSDEDYVEAFHEGKILRGAVLEVRSHPEDEMTESSIEDRYARGEAVSPEELDWAARRREARAEMDRHGLRHRVVTGNGRGRRWR